MYPSQPPSHPPHAPAPPPYTPHTYEPSAASGRRRTAPWRSKTLRAVALVSMLALSGVIIIGMVRQETGTEGFLVGLGLAVFPVPLLVAAFCWLDRVEPEPWRNLAFAFTWGACAATLVALLANGFATDWLAANIASTSPSEAEAWGATVIAPVVEEVVKAAAVLLLYRFRRREFDGITDGIVLAGITATGFAFTENVLYLGNAFGEDQSLGHSGLDSLTAGTFFLRIIVSPFAHPLFTILTGLAFGIAATRYPRRRAARIALALLGLLTAVLLHAIWNGASTLGDLGFLIVYGLFMVPVLIALTWLAIWARTQELLSLRGYLAPYITAGWLAPTEPTALSSLKTRALARDLTRRTQGPAAARAVTEYTAVATALSFHRRRAHLMGPPPDFAIREQHLLEHLREYQGWGRAALVDAWMAREQPYGSEDSRNRTN
ncbi:PrsW family intramembrane metalloprotease [Streptomyces sp. Je 1-4]|uniref:PrsW family intramembrane metalloprotease n=1 Tax=Streptomyces TaxID=1883 RepID=UPI0021DB6A6B|nr:MULTISPECIES: PrsW family intramembrane metalloprotease [unclassified Streptomyces]UYB41573.1 PrsW family intramembrane metalloprotease [Streptomyces sp. Je 1-4]UZQ37818.1 PrsW family intramembrane metalloprotease [Streptomyces sp. Je 1-4] [Streptomyces sp. Je 1-4 4N24]UZQ45235.1 PrsW family intramembrane metalloprotease [Streptomyces sp. Je 1-4] [Streptomyces sp. Je 1-4 4N24_ara]